MGTEVHVLLPGRSAGCVAPVRRLFLDWEATLSRFRPSSELVALNSRAGSPVVVSELLFQVVCEALDAAVATAGAFDPTLLHSQHRIGYDRSFDEMSETSGGPRSLSSSGGAWRLIRLDPAARIVELPPECALDVGGIAKGMAVDAALGLLASRDVDAALVSAGGDLAVRGLPGGGEPWRVAVGEHEDQVVPLTRGALATSGIARRSWRQGALSRHHILDPETGEPAESGIHEVTVAAATCAQAEVAATAAFVLGRDRGTELLRRHELAGRFTTPEGSYAYVGAWPTPRPVAA